MAKILPDLIWDQFLYIQVDQGVNQILRSQDRAPASTHRINEKKQTPKMSSILPDEAVFDDFRRQCLSTDNWVNKYDNNDMLVSVEVPSKKGNRGPKVHKIKVSFICMVCFWKHHRCVTSLTCCHV